MLRFTFTGLAALALVASSRDDARAGSIHSPITKAEAREARILLYEHEMTLRDANPTAFDHKNPVLGNLLSGEAGFGQFLEKHQFHHGLLCVHDPFIWRVVEGDVLYHKLYPFTNPSPPDFTVPSLPIDSVPGGGPPGGGGPNPGGPPGGSFHISGVPEPSSWVLMVSGVVVALYAASRRRKMVVIGPPGCPSPR